MVRVSLVGFAHFLHPGTMFFQRMAIRFQAHTYSHRKGNSEIHGIGGFCLSPHDIDTEKNDQPHVQHIDFEIS